MNRRDLVLGLFAGVLSAAGCRMCKSPFDYCGAVYDDHGYEWRERRGSILGSDPQATNLAPSGEAPAVEPTPAPESTPIDEPPRPPAKFSRRPAVSPAR
jgi:hypothetical protein